MKLKVMSLNLWLGGKLMDGILDFLAAENPDILLLQEAYNATNPALPRRFRSLQEIQELIPFAAQNFAAMYFEDLPEGRLERGNAILSKYPITSSQQFWLYGEYGRYDDVPGNYHNSPRNLQHAVINASDTILNVFNFQGVWDLDGDNDSPDRLQMSRVIVDAINDKENVILAGDTNATPQTKTMQAIASRLTDVFAGELETSFNVRRKDLQKFPGYATAVVDMAFVSPQLTISDHYCPQVDISDHLPLIFTLELT